MLRSLRKNHKSIEDEKLQEIIKHHIRTRDEQWFWRHCVISGITAFACFGIVIGGGLLTYFRTDSKPQLIAMVVVVSAMFHWESFS